LPVVGFLKKRRDINIHERPLPMRTNVSVQLIGVSTGPPPDPTPRPTATYDYQFRGWSGPEDLLTLCRLYLAEIKRMVADGRTKGFVSQS
jgi:hypothetical protein